MKKHALRSFSTEHGQQGEKLMFYVYIIRSSSHPHQIYVGFTEDLKSRLHSHNKGDCSHTSKYIPWELQFYCAFNKKKKALEFETYLKSHSGKAFSTKHLL